MPDADLILALRPIAISLGAWGIDFYVGGSVASSYHGASRSTIDVDLHCDLNETHVSLFVKQFTTEYYLSESAMKEAVRIRSCFNLIHYQTSFKVDIFVSKRRPCDLSALDRVEMVQLSDGSDLIVPVLSAEDTILVKLEWFQLGNQVSERQWDDLTRVTKIADPNLDIAYLKSTAASLGLSSLLDRLLVEVSS